MPLLLLYSIQLGQGRSFSSDITAATLQKDCQSTQTQLGRSRLNQRLQQRQRPPRIGQRPAVQVDQELVQAGRFTGSRRPQAGGEPRLVEAGELTELTTAGCVALRSALAPAAAARERTPAQQRTRTVQALAGGRQIAAAQRSGRRDEECIQRPLRVRLRGSILRSLKPFCASCASSRNRLTRAGKSGSRIARRCRAKSSSR